MEGRPMNLGYRLSACEGKHRYPSPGLAHEVAGRSRHPVSVYRCKACGGYHIGGRS